MTNRNQNVYVQITLWIEDNPDPPLDKEGRLMREYVADFTASGFNIEEIAEARKIYRRDYKYPKRNFSYLWDVCKQIRDRRLDTLTALEAWPLFWKIRTTKPTGKGWNVPVHHSQITIEMVMDINPKPSQSTARRLLGVVHAIGFKRMDTGNEAADRARFVQIYDTIDNRITDQETWDTPSNLLPEGSKTVKRLVEDVAQNLINSKMSSSQLKENQIDAR